MAWFIDLLFGSISAFTGGLYFGGLVVFIQGRPPARRARSDCTRAPPTPIRVYKIDRFDQTAAFR